MSYDHSVVNDDFSDDFWRPEFRSVPNVSTPRPRLKLVYISSVENFKLVMFQLPLGPTCAYAINTAEVK